MGEESLLLARRQVAYFKDGPAIGSWWYVPSAPPSLYHAVVLGNLGPLMPTARSAPAMAVDEYHRADRLRRREPWTADTEPDVWDYYYVGRRHGF